MKSSRVLALSLAVAAVSVGGQVSQASAATYCQGQLATIVGTDNPDRLTGTANRDVIAALGGNDLVDGAGGNDVVCGGSGDDRVMGGSGTNVVDGGLGNDACSSSSTDTRVACEPGMQTTLQPTRHGFPFPNFFTVSLPWIPGFGTISQAYGLCGGMAFAALDNWRLDVKAPGTATTPQSGQVFDYLWSRLLDSLTIDTGFNLTRFADLQLKSNSDLATISNSELAAIKAELPVRPTPVGVVIAQPWGAMWDNHQVLAIGWFTDTAGHQVLKVYDPNRPGAISYLDVTAKTLNGGAIRGIFQEHYSARTPTWA
jgi:hemolysin type calcium-binding protein